MHCGVDVRRKGLGGVSGAHVRKTAIEAYSLRHGASNSPEDAHSELLELKRRTTRGIAVRDIVSDIGESWVSC